MNFAAYVTIFNGHLTRFQTLALITTSEKSLTKTFVNKGIAPPRYGPFLM
jgi:hypothetical protein